ncbi:tetratricopeptide (TPR) repeat protein [Amycolatopsis lexingtonensis]|uniref:Tetratricopeptide (TPR) repeat protein n=1 Tax=Amycolatopsis lexingtonensis TaxID=218822 RepID=A0ABR9HZI6_9PSEU|nr:hypothetical protein [Amycolatopsis lexingtonensis]MBE1496331.1 tetratricopeptide (TPR) repeat protein [Amycolatopsis lexingtonensis]
MSLVHGHLPDPAQRVYELLADLPGPDTTAAPLACALGWPDHEVTAALQVLHAARLVEHQPPDRYRLADRYRRHAIHLRHQISPPVRAAQLAGVLGWYAASAGTAIPALAPHAHRFSPSAAHHGAVPATFASADQARTWFGREHHVLTSVVIAALDTRHDDLALELAEACWHLARPTYHHDDLAHIQHAGHTAAHRTAPEIAAVFQARHAVALADLGHHDDARTAAADTTDLAHTTADPRLAALAHAAAGRVLLTAGSPEAALRDLALALRHQRRLADDTHGHAVVHRRIGQAHLAHRRFTDAIRHLRESRDAMTRARNPLGTAQAVTPLAEALIETGRTGEAMGELGRARRRLGDTTALRYRAGLDLAAARAAHLLGDTGITRRLTHDLIDQLTGAGPGAATDLQTATDLYAATAPHGQR